MSDDTDIPDKHETMENIPISLQLINDIFSDEVESERTGPYVYIYLADENFLRAISLPEIHDFSDFKTQLEYEFKQRKEKISVTPLMLLDMEVDFFEQIPADLGMIDNNEHLLESLSGNPANCTVEKIIPRKSKRKLESVSAYTPEVQELWSIFDIHRKDEDTDRYLYIYIDSDGGLMWATSAEAKRHKEISENLTKSFALGKTANKLHLIASLDLEKDFRDQIEVRGINLKTIDSLRALKSNPLLCIEFDGGQEPEPEKPDYLKIAWNNKRSDTIYTPMMHMRQKKLGLTVIENKKAIARQKAEDKKADAAEAADKRHSELLDPKDKKSKDSIKPSSKNEPKPV